MSPYFFVFKLLTFSIHEYRRQQLLPAHPLLIRCRVKQDESEEITLEDLFTVYTTTEWSVGRVLFCMSYFIATAYYLTNYKLTSGSIWDQYK